MEEKDYEGREFDLAREEVLEELAIKYNESGKPCVAMRYGISATLMSMGLGR